MKWSEHMGWVKERCHGKRCDLLREQQCTDPVASRARKTIASRFSQFRMNKAPTGPYLAEVGQAEDDKCWWCSSSGSGPSQTREHLFKHCRRWKDQQAPMWRAIGRATGRKRPNTSRAQIFGDERCTAAILEFLATTEVGVTGRQARQMASDEHDGGERTGEDEDKAPSEGCEVLSEDEGG
jgi:hypothetical protein